MVYLIALMHFKISLGIFRPVECFVKLVIVIIWYDMMYKNGMSKNIYELSYLIRYYKEMKEVEGS